MKQTIWIQSSLGEAIRHLRKQQDMSQEELSLRANVSRNTISNIERGADTSMTTLQNILECLGYQININLTEK